MSDIAAELIENWLSQNDIELPNSQKKSPSPKKGKGVG